MKNIKRLNLLTNIIIFTLLVTSIGVNINLYFQNIKLSSSKAINKSSGKTTLWVPINAFQENEKEVEIFDVTKGEIIQKVILNNKIQKDVEDFLTGITGVYVKADALPKEGFIARVPIVISKSVKEKWLNESNFDNVTAVFVIFNNKESPYLLFLDDKGRPYFFNFSKNINQFISDLKLNSHN
jgi:hypothetical protein